MLYKRIIYAVLTVLFITLAYKAPFTERSLIPNLEPFPDSLYYSVPAWNFVHGEGFSMSYDGYEIKQITPPLYSLALIPFFEVFNDVRAFYFLNMLLVYGSLIFFVKTLYEIFDEKRFRKHILIAFMGFLFVTNFYIFTIPTLLMAETITLFLTTIGLYVLFSDNSKWKFVFSTQLGILLLLIKFSNAPLAVAFYALFFFKHKSKKFITYSLLGGVYFAAYVLGSKVLVDHKNLDSGANFSMDYFKKNFPFYINSFIGKDTRYLWFTEKYLPNILGALSVFGIIFGLMIRKYRGPVSKGLVLVVPLILFMSAFSVGDVRYIFALLPISLMFAAVVFSGFLKQSLRIGVFFMIIVLGVLMLDSSSSYKVGEKYAITLKKQVGLNFKHTESPWNYKAVGEFDGFFESQDLNEQAYLGTFLPPFYVEMVQTSEKYKPYPISEQQEFFWTVDGLGHEMGLQTDVEMIAAYTDLLEQNKPLYVSNYYISTTDFYKSHFDRLSEHFTLERVFTGCLESCNIYKLSLQQEL